MPKLTITYKDHVIFDGEVSEFSWSENTSSISVKARTAQPAAAGGARPGGSLMSILEKAAANQQAKTASHAKELRLRPNAPDISENGRLTEQADT